MEHNFHSSCTNFIHKQSVDFFSDDEKDEVE